MREVSVSCEVAASAEATWAVVTDIERAAEVIDGIESVERVDDGDEFGVGTRWRETRRMFKRAASEEMEVTAVDPGRSYTTEASSNGMSYTSVVVVEPLEGARSRVTMSLAGEAQSRVAGVFAAVMGRLLVRSVRKAFERDLDDIARAAEAAAD